MAALKAFVAALNVSIIGEQAIGHVWALSRGMALDRAACGGIEHLNSITAGHRHALGAFEHHRPRKQRGTRGVLPLELRAALIDGTCLSQRIAEEHTLAVKGKAREHRRRVGPHTLHHISAGERGADGHTVGGKALMARAPCLPRIHRLGLAAEALVVNLNPIAADIHDGISVAITFHIQRARHSRRYVAGHIFAPGVIMPVEVRNHGIVGEEVDVIFVVVEVVLQRIVIERQHTARRAGRQILIEGAAQPVQVLLLDMPVAHLHIRTAVDAYYHHVAQLTHKAVIAPQIHKGLRGRLAPGVLMIARQHRQGVSHAVKDTLHISKLGIRAFVG